MVIERKVSGRYRNFQKIGRKKPRQPIALEHHLMRRVEPARLSSLWSALLLFLSPERKLRATAQPQKGRSASGALVTVAVSKSVHAAHSKPADEPERRDALRRAATRGPSVFRRSTLCDQASKRASKRTNESAGRPCRAVESRVALSKPIANASRKRER